MGIRLTFLILGIPSSAKGQEQVLIVSIKCWGGTQRKPTYGKEKTHQAESDVDFIKSVISEVIVVKKPEFSSNKKYAAGDAYSLGSAIPDHGVRNVRPFQKYL